MKKHAYLAAMGLLAVLFVGINASANDSTEITWDDLVPDEAQWDDPFTRLDEDQLYALSLVFQIRERLEAGDEVDEQMLTNYHKRVTELEEQEVDIDGMIAMVDQVAEERRAKTFLANENLNGQAVRIPGYLLPLEYDGDLVSEFLLVPYVGACIHTPPPPPNQIVHVKIEDGFASEGGLFEPIWVDGIIKTERSESNLTLVDGTSDIPSSYRIDATSIKVYE